MPDPQPLHDDWVITRPRLTGICGSDSKQILLDFGEGDTDNAMAAFCSFPQVMGHEVVADVVAMGPKARGSGGRPARRAQPVAVVRAAWHRTALSRMRKRGLQPVLELHRRRHQAGHPYRGVGRRDRRLRRADAGARQHAAPCPASRCPTNWRCSPTRSRCPCMRSPGIRRRRRAGCWSTGPAPSGSCAVAILTALYPDVEVAVVARFDAQAQLAERLGRGQGAGARAAAGPDRGAGRVGRRPAAAADAGPADGLSRAGRRRLRHGRQSRRRSRSGCGYSRRGGPW